MTQEEKAKAYDEAIKRAQAKIEEAKVFDYDDEQTAHAIRLTTTDIFPELKESEDEKIRKWIRKELESKYVVDNIVNNVMADKALAWLEKQGQVKESLISHHENKTCKESDDSLTSEDIRKGLIQYFSTFTLDTFAGLDPKKILSWLEKQGEQKPVPKFKVGDTMRTLQEANNGYTDGMPVVVSIDNEYYHCTNELIAIKDQDNYEFPPINVKQKPAPKFKVGDKIQYSKGCGTIMTIEKIENGEYIFGNNMGHTTIESGNKWHLVEQKPIDSTFEIKPKFKVGDTIRELETGNLFYVNSIEDFGYTLHYKNYNAKGCTMSFKYEDNYELVVEPKFHEREWITNGDYTWQIVEVKPLDYILRSQDGNTVDDTISHVDEQFHSFTIKDANDGDVLYCWIDGDEFILIYKGVKDGYITTYGHLYQKFKLFAEEPTTMFCRTIQGHFTPATKEQGALLFQKMKEAGYMWDTDKKELKKISQEYPLTSDECIKPAWSKEDEKIIRDIHCFLDYRTNCHSHDQETKERAKKIVSWLDELKERVQPQPKQKWSEEDEKMYRGLHNLIYSTPYCNSRKELSDFLDFLKNRVHSNLQQEWSKDDEKCIRLSTDIIDSALRAGFCVQLDRDKCVDWLKSLKDRYAWKPSDEQMNWFRDILDFHQFSSEGQKRMQSLYDDLKKLKGESYESKRSTREDICR